MPTGGGFRRLTQHALTHAPGGYDPLDPALFDFAQEVTVGISGGQYTSIRAACLAVAPLATAATPYIVTVGPGVYNEDPFTVPSYVCVNGTGGLYTAVLQANSDLAHFISGSPAGEIRNVAVRGPAAASGFACVDYQGLGFVPFRVKNIRLISGDIGIWCHPATYGVCTVSEAINFTDGALAVAFMKVSGWGELRVSNSSYRREAGASCIDGFNADGINAYMVVDNCAFKDAGSTHGGFVNNGGYLRMTGCTFTAGVTALRVGPNGANSRINALSTVIRDAFTNDLVISSPTGVVQFSGAAHKSKITAAGGSSLIANFSDPAGGAAEGQVNLGEFYIGDISGNEMPVRDYLWFNASTGLTEGGEVTRNVAGGLKLNVAAGECFISLTGTTGVLEHYWGGATLDMTDDSHSWITVDSTGTLVEVFAEPDGKTSIALAEVVTRSGAVVFLGQGTIVDLYQGHPRMHRYTYETNGPRCVSGVSTTADGIPLQLDIDGGSFYIGDNRLTVLPGSAVTFTAWYRAAGGAWVAVPSQTLIDDEQYNIPAGGLGAIPGAEYTGHVTYVASTEDGAEYHVVYGQMTNAAPAGLTLPTAPDWLSRTACRSGQVIVLKSAGAIDSINDVRPFSGTTVTGGGAVAEHSLLGGLAVGDDHPQYQLRTEKDVNNGYCGLGATGLVAQTRLDMTAVPALAVAEPAGASAGGTAPGAKPAWEDHVHEHGTLTGGAHHAVAVAGVSNGFLSAADKTRLDTTVLTTRTLTAGNGLTGGGDLSVNRSFTVSPHADGSIVVGAGGVQVGILASDAQHGNLGGGGIHAVAIAAGAAGFLSGADKTKIDGLAINHAARHAVGQPDVLTPLAIGATYPVFAQTESVSVIANGVEGTFVGAGVGSVTLPANFFAAGKTIRIKAYGYYTRTTGDDLRVRIYLDATVILDTGVRSPSTVGPFGWALETDITCRTAGAPGTVMGQGRLELSTSATASVIWQLANTGAAINVTTTGALVVNCTALWNGAGNSFTCTNLVITSMN